MNQTLIFFSLFLLSLSGHAQQQAQHRTNRPGFADKLTNSISSNIYTANLMPTGRLQVEADLLYAFELLGSGSDYTRYRQASLPDLLLRYGIAKNIELRAGTRVGYSYIKTELSPIPGSDPVLGELPAQSDVYTDYLTLGIKAELSRYGQGKGNLLMLAETYVPLLRKEETRGDYLFPHITFVNTYDLNKWLRINLNLGLLLPEILEGDYSREYTFSISPVFTVAKPLRLFAGIERNESFIFHQGLLFASSGSLQFRGSFSFSTDSAPLPVQRYYSSIGIMWRLKSFQTK